MGVRVGKSVAVGWVGVNSGVSVMDAVGVGDLNPTSVGVSVNVGVGGAGSVFVAVGSGVSVSVAVGSGVGVAKMGMNCPMEQEKETSAAMRIRSIFFILLGFLSGGESQWAGIRWMGRDTGRARA